LHFRHARRCGLARIKTWMAGTSPAMTIHQAGNLPFIPAKAGIQRK
jgi:hypothetical protein